MFAEKVKLNETVQVCTCCKHSLNEVITLGRASMEVTQRRPKEYKIDEVTGLLVPNLELKDHMGNLLPRLEMFDVLNNETVWNLITNAGRIFLHTQGYGTSSLATNGLNYIALSNDTVTETATSTTLSTEIVANGLSRAQGTVTLPVGSGNQTTVDHTFTCATANQSAQKAALFSAVSSGTMNHVLGFTQRNLIPGDTLEITYTITLG